MTPDEKNEAVYDSDGPDGEDAVRERNATVRVKPVDTVEAAQRILTDIARRFPDTVNPVNGGGTCVYRQVGADGTVRRCFIGQFGHERGFRDPGSWNGDAYDAAFTFDWPVSYEVARYLRTIQERADRDLPTWGVVDLDPLL